MDLLKTLTKIRQPLRIAHRGSLDLYPENTMIAFGESITSHYVDMIELDLRLSKDGKAVVIHDSTVDRTCDGKGKVSDKTYDELSQLDAGYHFDPNGREEFPQRGNGVRIPLFEEVVREFSHTFINAELKDTDPELVEKVKQVIEKYGAHKRMLIGSGQYFQHRRVRNLLPDCYHFMSRIDLYLFASVGSKGFGKNYFKKFDVVEAPFQYKKITCLPYFKKAANLNGMHLFIWGANDEKTIQKVLDTGVQGILSDRVDLI